VTYFQLFQSSVKKLNPDVEQSDLQKLIEFSFKISSTEFWTQKDPKKLNMVMLQDFYNRFVRLNLQEPLAYIRGYQDFYKYRFKVGKQVLIPRSETEILVEKIIETISHPLNLIEIGAGSGNIAISLALETKSKIIAVEKSRDAYQILQQNINEHQVQELVTAENVDFFDKTVGEYDMLISNPPYIKTHDMDKLPPSVKNYEPWTALYGGEEGTEFLNRIIQNADNILKPSGYIFLEIGYDQGSTVCDILKRNGYSEIVLFKDLNQIDRVVKARK
jgi:release factor glutamine methyltransferase